MRTSESSDTSKTGLQKTGEWTRETTRRVYDWSRAIRDPLRSHFTGAAVIVIVIVIVIEKGLAFSKVGQKFQSPTEATSRLPREFPGTVSHLISPHIC